MSASDEINVVTMVNDSALFDIMRQSLSPDRQGIDVKVHPCDPSKAGMNAGQALNAAVFQSDCAWTVIAHQDVVFPANWIRRLLDIIAGLPPEVAILGVMGCTRWGELCGHIIDPHGHYKSRRLPREVVSLDECLLVVRQGCGLRFDETLPGFHCYGADIACQAWSSGFRAMAIDCPVVHLSPGNIDESYSLASSHLMAKWGAGCGGVLPTPARLLVADQYSCYRYLTCRALRRLSAYRARQGGGRRGQYRMLYMESAGRSV